jgi:VWFA-related protein
VPTLRVASIAPSLLLLSSPGFTQTAEPDRAPVFGTSVEVVAVPVFVTDRQGQPVPGLRPEDFEVRDAGEPRQVLAVHEIDTGTPSVDLGSAAAEAVARRQFLLLFDLSFSSPAGIVRARQAASDLVRTGLGPGDLAAVATYSANAGVRILVTFTTDREQLARAIATLGVLRREGVPDPLGLAFELGGGEGGMSREEALGMIDGDVESQLRHVAAMVVESEMSAYRKRVEDYLSGLAQLGRALDAVRGRKQVILFSSGFDERVLRGGEGAEAFSNARAVSEGRLWEVPSDSHFGGDSQTRRSLDDAMKLLAGSDTVVHAVDVSGLGSGEGDVSDAAGIASHGSGGESLSQLSNRSGGMLVKNTNDVRGGLGDVLDASRRFYVLAFAPGRSRGPGRFHELKVEVARKGLRVSHRRGYAERGGDDGETTALAQRLEAAETIAKGITGGAIGLDVIAVPYRDAEGTDTLPVVVAVDGASLLDRGPGDALRLEIYGYALDADGRIEDVMTLSPTLSLPTVGETIRRGGLQIQTAFRLGPGPHDLRFLVRDAETGRAGSWRALLEVPSLGGDDLVVYPPLFMAEADAGLVLPVPSNGVPRPELPFHVIEEPFGLRLRPSLQEGRPERVCVMVHGAALESDAQLALSARLVSSSGEAVRFGALTLAQAVVEADGFRRFVVAFTPQGVAAGDYSFRVELRDPRSGATASATQDVRFD